MNKTIYMTYYKNIPPMVSKNWLKLNKTYKIDFSLDKQCIEFLESNFNKNISDIFKIIKKGMYKADLWRLCKLYINSGVYADVDLAPYLRIDQLDKDIEFYSCLSVNEGSIFQAFMVNFSKPKNPLILIFLLSFLINKPIVQHDGPTFDMYKCLHYMISDKKIKSGKRYNLNEVKIQISIGNSKENCKDINLYYFPTDINYTIRLCDNPYSDVFDFDIKNNILSIKRTDSNTGWSYGHFIDICFPHKTSILLFTECGPDSQNPVHFVTHNNKKILDSRYIQYVENGGW
jgi:hypothetical protein